MKRAQVLASRDRLMRLVEAMSDYDATQSRQSGDGFVAIAQVHRAGVKTVEHWYTRQDASSMLGAPADADVTLAYAQLTAIAEAYPELARDVHVVLGVA